MSERATCWSITINNPTEGEVNCQMHPGWVLTGQYEEGEEGTRHFQGMLTTPQVRFSAVKRIFPRAHIEIARNKKALAEYVTKEDSRVASFEGNATPNIFQYQRKVCENWSYDQYERLQEMYHREGHDEVALRYVDLICSQLIREGARGLEFIAINPMWRSSWKKFYSSIINRYASPPPSSQPSTQGP